MSYAEGRESDPGPPSLARRRSFTAEVAPPGSPGVESVRSAPPNFMTIPGSPGASSVKSHASQVSLLSNASSSSITGSVSISNILALTICPICFLPPLNPRAMITPCGHTFCSSCMNKWAQHGAGGRNYIKCPSCRVSFRKEQLTRNIMVENLLEQVLGLEPNEEEVPPPPVTHPPSSYLPAPPPPPPSNPSANPTVFRAGATPIPRSRHTENHLLLMGRIRQLGGVSPASDSTVHGLLMNGIRNQRRVNLVNRSRNYYTNVRSRRQTEPVTSSTRGTLLENIREGRSLNRVTTRSETQPSVTEGGNSRTTLLEQIRLGRNRVFESQAVGGEGIYPPFYAGGS
ncbi:hypothetical protein TrST_g2644 [Triparma strigata]|uniref:RING-type domain-containing protein n=1 Tax=Triparma strigata TaxID=1606541 RepID=A0A9W7EW21_9STRA|nr:hypothetical protein TrST_g2644 [Triparma strigata]